MSSGSHVRGDPWLIQVLTPVAILATAVVGIRLFLRFSRRAGLWFDDWSILASLVLVWGLYIVSVLCVELGGIGTPFEQNLATDPSMVFMEDFFKLLYAGQIIYASTILTAKLSILALYWRLFPTAFMKRGCVVLAVLTIMWWMAGVLVNIFQCTPIGKAFKPALEGDPSCISQTGYCLGMVIPNLLIDISILSLPTFEIAKLHLPRSQKIALGSVFLLGGGVTAASAMRMYYHLELVEAARAGDLDFTMSIVNPQLWMALEPDMAIICACLPIMRPLVTMLLASPLYRSLASYLANRVGTSSAKNSKSTTSNTIGGSSGAPSSAARREVRSDNRSSTFRPSGYALSSFDSLEYLRDEDVETGRSVREGRDWTSQGDNNIRCQTQVSRSRSVGPDEVPLGAISVKTVVDCRETTL